MYGFYIRNYLIKLTFLFQISIFEEINQITTDYMNFKQRFTQANIHSLHQEKEFEVVLNIADKNLSINSSNNNWETKVEAILHHSWQQCTIVQQQQ